MTSENLPIPSQITPQEKQPQKSTNLLLPVKEIPKIKKKDEYLNETDWLITKPCPNGQFNNGACYIESFAGENHPKDIPIEQIALYYAQHFRGTIDANRIHIWLSTIPQDSLPVAVSILDKLKYVGLAELQERMLSRMDQALEDQIGNVLFVAPIAVKSNARMHESSAAIIGTWYQNHLTANGWQPEVLIERNESAGYKNKHAILKKDGRVVIITDTNEFYDFQNVPKPDAVVLFDDWSISGTHLQEGINRLARAMQAFYPPQNIPVSIAYGYMTEKAEETMIDTVENDLQSKPLINGKDDDFAIETADSLLEGTPGYNGEKELNKLTKWATTGSSLNPVLITSAISTPDNLLNLVRSGMSTDEFRAAFPGKKAPLVLNPRTGLERKIYIT